MFENSEMNDACSSPLVSTTCTTYTCLKELQDFTETRESKGLLTFTALAVSSVNAGRKPEATRARERAVMMHSAVTIDLFEPGDHKFVVNA